MVDTRETTLFVNEGFFRAYSRAFTAFGTQVLYKANLRPGRNTFRVTAPPAFQAAAFKENHRSYARPVMDGVPLNISDQIGHK